MMAGPGIGGSCGGGASPQLVYEVNPPVQGQLQVILHPTAFRGAVYIREVCGTASTELAGGCIAGTMPGASLPMTVFLSRTTSYHVFVDGNMGDAGAFALDFYWQPNNRCGDRALTASEQCDDGNNADGDGCNSGCMLEGTATNACPGRALRLAPGVQVYSGTTVGATGAWTEPCATTGADRLYQLNIAAGTSLRVDVYPTSSRFDPVINVHGTSCISTAGAICVDAAAVGIFETTTLPVTAGSPLWLTVDSAGTTVGPYFMRFTLM